MFQPLELPNLSPLSEIIRQVREELLREAREGHPEEMTELLTGLETELGAQQAAMETIVPGELEKFKIDHDQVVVDYNTALSRHSERVRKAFQESAAEVVRMPGDTREVSQGPANLVTTESPELNQACFSPGADLVAELINLTPQVFPGPSHRPVPRFMRTSGNIWENWNLRQAKQEEEA